MLPAVEPEKTLAHSIGRLDLALLVDGQGDHVGPRIDIKPDDVPDLGS